MILFNYLFNYMSGKKGIPHGVTFFGVGAAATSLYLTQKRSEAQSQINAQFRNEVKNDLNKLKEDMEEIKKGQELLIKSLDNSKKFINNLDKLSITELFNKSIEFDLIRLHYPYNDSNILVNLIYFLIKKISIIRVLKKLFKKAIIKKSNFNYYNQAIRNKNLFAFISGININFGGRFTKKIIPRKSRKIYSKGIISKNKINYLDISRISNKNRLGSYSITITSGQTLF